MDPVPKLPAGTLLAHGRSGIDLDGAISAQLALGCAACVLESSCYTVFAPRCVRVILAPKHPGATVLAIGGASSPLVFAFWAGAALASTSLVLELTSRTLVA